jgi:hypothetical protein
MIDSSLRLKFQDWMCDCWMSFWGECFERKVGAHFPIPWQSEWSGTKGPLYDYKWTRKGSHSIQFIYFVLSVSPPTRDNWDPNDPPLTDQEVGKDASNTPSLHSDFGFRKHSQQSDMGPISWKQEINDLRSRSRNHQPVFINNNFLLQIFNLSSQSHIPLNK